MSTFLIESIDGITAGPYSTEKAAKRAAKHANSIAPWQRWHTIPENEVTELNAATIQKSSKVHQT
jgi:hypothetical protein